MKTSPRSEALDPTPWARDFAIVGAAIGGAAPFFVIFDVSFALVGGFVATASGAVLGALTGWLVHVVRDRVPLSVWIAGMAVVGSLWGAAAGTLGGASGTAFGEIGVLLGFIVGGCTGMVALGSFFPAYLFLSVTRRRTWPAVAALVCLAPLMGWMGIGALAASSLGLWLFALPLALWAGVAIDRSTRVAQAWRREGVDQVADERRTALLRSFRANPIREF